MARKSGSYQKVDGKLVLLHATQPAAATIAPAPRKSAKATTGAPVKPETSPEWAAPKPVKED